MKITLHYKFNDDVLIGKELMKVVMKDFKYDVNVPAGKSWMSVKELFDSNREKALQEAAYIQLRDLGDFLSESY